MLKLIFLVLVQITKPNLIQNSNLTASCLLFPCFLPFLNHWNISKTASLINKTSLVFFQGGSLSQYVNLTVNSSYLFSFYKVTNDCPEYLDFYKVGSSFPVSIPDSSFYSVNFSAIDSLTLITLGTRSFSRYDCFGASFNSISLTPSPIPSIIETPPPQSVATKYVQQPFSIYIALSIAGLSLLLCGIIGYISLRVWKHKRLERDMEFLKRTRFEPE